MDDLHATISFCGEAHDSAAESFELLCPHNGVGGRGGYCVQVVRRNGDTFDAEVREVVVDESDGQWKVVLAAWVEEAGHGDRDNPVVLDIYDDIERVVVY